MKKILVTLFLFVTLGSSAATKIGIGIVVDSVSHMSRSFAMFELLNRNRLVKDTDVLTPVLTDYFPYETPFGITGSFTKRNCTLTIFKEGKVLRELTTGKEWSQIFNSIANALAEFGYRRLDAFTSVGEGSTKNLGSGSINNYVPGMMVYEVPGHSRLDSLKRWFKLEYKAAVDPFQSAREVYGNFITYKENDIFFFRNDRVPADIRKAIYPLIYPRYNSLYPTLLYMANAFNLKSQDRGASMNLLFASLNTSTRIVASRFEKTHIRRLIFQELADFYSSMDKPGTSRLFRLAADLNRDYYLSEVGKKEQRNYDYNIGLVEAMAREAENKAREIRSANWTGAITAAAVLASEVQYVASGDKQRASATAKQFGLVLDQYSSINSEATTLLAKKFENIDKQVNSNYFIDGEEAEVKIMRNVIVPEVKYLLGISPEIYKSSLMLFSDDKPKLKELVSSFFEASGAIKEVRQEKIYRYLRGWESEATSQENRGLKADVAVYEKKLARRKIFADLDTLEATIALNPDASVASSKDQTSATTSATNTSVETTPPKQSDLEYKDALVSIMSWLLGRWQLDPTQKPELARELQFERDFTVKLIDGKGLGTATSKWVTNNKAAIVKTSGGKYSDMYVKAISENEIEVSFQKNKKDIFTQRFTRIMK